MTKLDEPVIGLLHHPVNDLVFVGLWHVIQWTRSFGAGPLGAGRRAEVLAGPRGLESTEGDGRRRPGRVGFKGSGFGMELGLAEERGRWDTRKPFMRPPRPDGSGEGVGARELL